MGKINVYLPSDLEEEVKKAKVPVSTICQEALREAIGVACNHPELLRQPSGRYRCASCSKQVDIRKRTA